MSKPLADLIRPESIDDIVGQEHLLGENKVLRKIYKEHIEFLESKLGE